MGECEKLVRKMLSEGRDITEIVIRVAEYIDVLEDTFREDFEHLQSDIVSKGGC